LFECIGILYGEGDGSTTFNLPDLRGRDVIGSGHGYNLTNRIIGDKGGEEKHIMTEQELPSHNHRIYNSDISGTDKSQLLGGGEGIYQNNNIENTQYIENTGENQPMNIMQPYTVCNYIIKVKPIVSSLLTQPFNFWKKNSDKIYYTDGNIGIGTSTPECQLHIEGDICQSGNSTTRLKSTTIDGYIRTTIKRVNDENNLLNGGLIQLDISSGSNFSIDLDISNNILTIELINLSEESIGQKGDIYIFERSNNRYIHFDNKMIHCLGK
jgi:microcystin-dependent protein